MSPSEKFKGIAIFKNCLKIFAEFLTEKACFPRFSLVLGVESCYEVDGLSRLEMFDT